MNKIILYVFTMFTVFIFMSSVPVLSQVSDTDKEKKTETGATGSEANLGKVVVTAGRSEQKLENIPQSVVLISKEDIERTNATDVTDVLKKNAGVDVIQYPGALSGIGIRGFRPEYSGTKKHSLLLVNGMPAGATNLATIPLDNIERIEVLKGPASSLYGSQAMGGVVNIITKNSKGKVKSSVNIGGGSYKTWYGGLSSGGSVTDNWDYDISGRAEQQLDDQTLGNNKLEDNFGSFENGVKRPNTSYKEYSGAARIGGDMGFVRMDMSGNFYKGVDIETPGDEAYGINNQSNKDIDRFGGDIKFSGSFFSDNTLSLSGYTSMEENQYQSKSITVSGKYVRVPAYKSSESKTTWLGGSFMDTQKIAFADITAGIDYMKEVEDGKSWNQNGTRKSRSNPDCETATLGIFGESLFTFFSERLVINAGIRYDRIELETKKTPYYTTFMPSSETLEAVMPRAGVKVKPTGFLNLHSTIGKAFVAPTPYQMAGYNDNGTTITRGNPDLDPESSVTWDAGIGMDVNRAGLFWDITYFSTDVKDKITTVASPGYKDYVNADTAKIRGLEFEFSIELARIFNLNRSIKIFTNYTEIIKAEEKTQSGTDNIDNVSDRKITSGIDYDDGHFLNMRLSHRYTGHQTDTDWTVPSYPDIKYPSFWVMDFSLGLRFGEMHKVGVKLGNIFDKYYYEKRGYAMPGRTIYADYTFTF